MIGSGTPKIQSNAPRPKPMSVSIFCADALFNVWNDIKFHDANPRSERALRSPKAPPPLFENPAKTAICEKATRVSRYSL